MEALILDRNYEALDIVDTFESFIWTDRFREAGDFELYMPMTTSAIEVLETDRYLYTRNSDRYMIVEEIEIETDVEAGNHLKVTGRSLESILDRRIIWNRTNLTGSVQNGIKKLLDENIISPTDDTRRIPGFRFEASTDTRITDLEMDAQFFGENLYDAIFSICELHDIGFKVLPEGAGGFVFKLYAGTDRSYRQEANPWVIFSPNFDNLLSSNYFESKTNYKTTALTAGQGEGEEQKLIEAPLESGAGSGLDRRELFVEATGITMETRDEEGNELTGSALQEAERQYMQELKTKGLEALSESGIEIATEGEVDAKRQFVYGTDFTIGDIVQVVNEYDMEMVCRISEVVQSHDLTGETMYPTFIQI